MKKWRKPTMQIFSYEELSKLIQAAACSGGFYCIGGHFR